MAELNIVILKPAAAGAIGGRKRAERIVARRTPPHDQQMEQRPDGLGMMNYREFSVGPDRPLRIADIEIPCYVLGDETRVLSQRGVVGSLGMKYGSRIGGADRLTGFLIGKTISDNVSNELMVLIGNPIKFRGSGGITFGYPATILADICEAVLAARRAGTLQKQQEHIADRAEILIRGFARVGIIALVDEATGYQEIRARDDLHRILEAYIAKELLPWTKRFPDEFFKEMFRVWGWPWPPAALGYRGPQGPRYAGKLVRQLIYENLPVGVLPKLDEIVRQMISGSAAPAYHRVSLRAPGSRTWIS